ncbi:hypothetical protein [Granulicoccus phenolivorans]|uniref:hypothetical protein n=1 Tax=Granulicoccus phenolivorans TaxID=266854 RepID=UPI000410BDFB|nr:hypothetical protein [Granulicoccus phenolivorans]
MTQADRRRQVLLAWAHALTERGEQVPTRAQLVEIAAVRGIPPSMRTPLMDRWVEVINNLLWLSDQGHPDPVSEGLRMQPRPVPGFPPPQPAAVGVGGVNPQIAQQLAAWQQQAVQADQFARQAMAYGNQADARNWLIRKQHAEREMENLRRFAAAQSAASAASATSYGSAGSYGSATSQGSATSYGSATEAVSGVPAPAPEPAWQPTEPVADEPVAAEAVAEIVEAEVIEAPVSEPETVEAEVIEASDAAPVEPEIDPLQKLMVWRDRSGSDEVKDRHLRQIVNSGARTEAEVAVGLPASLKYLAPTIADVLGLRDTPPPQAPPAAPAPTTAQLGPQPGPAPAETGRPELLNPGAISWQQPMELAQALSGFAAMDFTVEGGEPQRLKASALADRTTSLRWPAVDAPAGTSVLYRVVADDEHVPYSPDMSEVIAITKQTELIDNRPFYSAVRHYQVWVNTGRDDRDAQLNQPVLHALVPVVAKPEDVDIREDEGRVIGQWRVFPEATKVQIFRVPAERAHAGAGNPMYRILEAEPNLGGFVDDTAETGKRYIYQLLVQAEVEGTPQLSLPTIVPVTTSAVLHGVPDLACRLNDDQAHPQFDLTWSPPPAGRVVIYRTEEPPVAGADAETVPEEALPQMQLRPDARLAHPIEQHESADGGRAYAMMRNVPWPRNWSRLYFTPVTILDGKAKVGTTTSQVRTGRVEDATVVERVSQQVLTMAWPVGAANIKVYAGALGQPAEEAIPGAEPIAEISEETYRRLGGLHFPRPLDPGGCDLHLVPVSFAGGQSVEGKPTTVRYRGLLTLAYHLEVQRGAFGRGQAILQVTVRADRFNPSSPPFALVHNPNRLPLDVRDGETLPVLLNNNQPQQPTTRFRLQSLNTSWAVPGWIADVTNRTGWVRLFVDLAPNPQQGTVALLDPPVANLWLGDPR